MNVILLEKVGKLGGVGDTATVKSGYARNFLFPRGKAIAATKANLAEFEQRRADLLAAHNEKVALARSRAARVDGTRLVIEVNASEEGKLFGSVGTRDIAEALNRQTGSDMQKSEVVMPHGVIRQLGEYSLQLNLGQDVTARITVAVVPAGAVDPMDDADSQVEEVGEAEQTAESAPAQPAQAPGDDTT